MYLQWIYYHDSDALRRAFVVDWRVIGRCPDHCGNCATATGEAQALIIRVPPGLHGSKKPTGKPGKPVGTPDGSVCPGFLVRLGIGSRSFFEPGQTGRTLLRLSPTTPRKSKNASPQ
jgi:hypothetical protein